MSSTMSRSLATLAVLCLAAAMIGAQVPRGSPSVGGRGSSGATRGGSANQPVPGTRGASPAPPGTERDSSAGQRKVSEGERLQRKERKAGERGGDAGDGDGSGPGDPGDVAPRSEAERAAYQKQFLAEIEKRDAAVKDASMEADLLVLPVEGRVRKLHVSYRYLNPGGTQRRHRISVWEVVGGLKALVEDLILHETRGARIAAWRRGSEEGWVPYRGAVLSHRLAATKLTLEAFLPFDHARYRVEYEGVGFRDGRRTDLFEMKPRVAGTSRMEVAWRLKERIPCRFKAYEGKDQVWGSVGSKLRIRDGRYVLDRRTVVFPAAADSVVIKVLSRSLDKGLGAGLFDPARKGS